MALSWRISPIPEYIPFEYIYAVYLPRNIFDGNNLGDLVRVNTPVVKSYATYMSVFFRFVREAPFSSDDKEVKCESVMGDDNNLLGYRYFFMIKAQDEDGKFDPDKLIRDEIVLFFEKNGKNAPKKFKNDLKRFLLLWRTLFGGMGDWVINMANIMPDLDIHDIQNHIASECFSLEAAGCDTSVYLQDGNLEFPDRTRVVDIPLWNVSIIDKISFPDFYLEELRLKRYRPEVIGNIARAFREEGTEVERPCQRKRSEPDTAVVVTDPIHKFLPLAVLALHIKKVFRYIDSMPEEDKKLKVFMKEFCLDKFCDSFSLELLTSSMRSPADHAFHAFSKQTHYFEGKDVHLSSNVWIKKSLDAQNFTGSKQLFYFQIFLAAMDAFHDIDRNHGDILRLNFFGRDATRLEFSTMHLSELMHSRQGGVGKSHILMMIFFLSITGTATKINRFTPASFAVHGTEKSPDCPNQCGMINIGDDWDPEIFGNNPKESRAQSALKTIMSDGTASLQALSVGDDGQRTQQSFQAPVMGSWLIAFNANEIKSHPIRRRANDTSASEAPSSTLSSTILESWTNQVNDDDTFLRQAQASQYWNYLVHQLQYCGMLPKFTMDGSVRFIDAVFEFLKRCPECPWFSKIDASFLSRLKSLAKVLTIDYITMDTFSRLEDKEITVRDVMKLKPRMWIPVDKMASAAFFLIEEWFSPMKFAVFDALKRLIRKNVEECHGHFKELFWADYIDNKKIPDYNWLRLSKPEAANKISQEVCDMMGGNFVPNPKKIEEIFESFAGLAPKKVPEYYLVREYPKALGRVEGTEKQKSLFNIEQGLKFDYLKISVYYFEDLLVMDDIEKPFIGLGPSFTKAYNEHTKSDNINTRIDFTQSAATKIIPEKEIKPSELQKTLDDWGSYAAEDIAKDMSSFLIHIDPEDDVTDEEECYMLNQLESSIFWNPNYEGQTWKQVVTDLKERGTQDYLFKKSLVEVLEEKCRFFFEEHYDYDFRSKSLVKKRNMGIDYDIHWFRNNDRKIVINEEQFDYKTRAHDLVERAMRQVMTKKNQFERTIYGGTDPDKPWKMRSFVIGDISSDNAPAYDPEKGFSFKVKNRELDELGEYLKSMMPQWEGDVFINYDLDILTQEEHLRNIGLDDVIVTSKIFEEISTRMLSDSSQTEWEGKYLHGVEMTELVPLSAQDAESAAKSIRRYVNRIPDNHFDKDLHFPEEIARKQDPIIEKMGLGYFHMDSINDSQTTCWIPFLCDLIH